HRLKVAGRGIDDLQHFSGCGLLLQRLARLGQEPRVFHRDHRLLREILEERDLLLGKWPDFSAVGHDLAEQLVLYAQWHEERSAKAAQFGCEDRKLIASICDIGDVDEPCSAEQLSTNRIFCPAVTLPHPFREALRQSAGCNGTKGLAVVKFQCA